MDYWSPEQFQWMNRSHPPFSNAPFAQPVPYGLVVRIPAFHAGGPGSIPGVGGILNKLLGWGG